MASIAIIGQGYMANTHAAAWASIGQAESIKYICTPRPKEGAVSAATEARYISELDVVRGGFGIYKIKETQKLDQMVYCFLTFLRSKLTKIKLAAFAIDNVKELAIRIESIYDEIEKEGMPSIYAIDKEIRDVAIINHIIE